ncbi:MAG: hypothetical protein GC165_06125 [Armatimonadetes bacterium]|nr:hypothetical protein [Armatimonadota bacterium]MBS1726064.1 hypothetical protein [Armatimonadota bacterium]
MHPEPREYLEFIACYSPELQALHRAARQRLLDLLPSVIELMFDATQAVTTGFSFTEKSRDHFIHLPMYGKGINLGFNHGAKLHDPEGRLIGTGSQVRHLKLRDLAVLDDPYVLDLIEQSMALAPKPDGEVEPKTVIRVMEGAKRRPGK